MTATCCFSFYSVSGVYCSQTFCNLKNKTGFYTKLEIILAMVWFFHYRQKSFSYSDEFVFKINSHSINCIVVIIRTLSKRHSEFSDHFLGCHLDLFSPLKGVYG